MKVDDRFFSIYNNFLICKHKDKVEIDVTSSILEFEQYLTEIDIKPGFLPVNLIIYGLIFNNNNLKEALLDVFSMLKMKLEPEFEHLLIEEIERITSELFKRYPVLKNSRLIIPYDVTYINNKVYVKCVLCAQ